MNSGMMYSQLLLKSLLTEVRIHVTHHPQRLCLTFVRPSTDGVCDTGGKGRCTEPVHHKYIARKWTMYPAFTHSVHLKYIQKFP